MESSSYELNASVSSLEFLSLFLFRPLLAIVFVFSLLILGWFLAWKLVLVHVPLVQEIFGLRKKTVKPKPENRRRYTQIYNNMDSQSAASQWLTCLGGIRRVSSHPFLGCDTCSVG